MEDRMSTTSQQIWAWTLATFRDVGAVCRISSITVQQVL